MVDTPRTQEPPEVDPQLKRTALKALSFYFFLRVMLVIVLSVVIGLIAYLIDSPVPLALIVLLALLVALPLSLLIFERARTEATAAVAHWDSQRKARKQWIKEELSAR